MGASQVEDAARRATATLLKSHPTKTALGGPPSTIRPNENRVEWATLHDANQRKASSDFAQGRLKVAHARSIARTLSLSMDGQQQSEANRQISRNKLFLAKN